MKEFIDSWTSSAAFFCSLWTFCTSLRTKVEVYCWGAFLELTMICSLNFCPSTLDSDDLCAWKPPGKLRLFLLSKIWRFSFLLFKFDPSCLWLVCGDGIIKNLLIRSRLWVPILLAKTCSKFYSRNIGIKLLHSIQSNDTIIRTSTYDWNKSVKFVSGQSLDVN